MVSERALRGGVKRGLCRFREVERITIMLETDQRGRGIDVLKMVGRVERDRKETREGGEC